MIIATNLRIIRRISSERSPMHRPLQRVSISPQLPLSNNLEFKSSWISSQYSVYTVSQIPPSTMDSHSHSEAVKSRSTSSREHTVFSPTRDHTANSSSLLERPRNVKTASTQNTQKSSKISSRVAKTRCEVSPSEAHSISRITKYSSKPGLPETSATTGQSATATDISSESGAETRTPKT